MLCVRKSVQPRTASGEDAPFVLSGLRASGCVATFKEGISKQGTAAKADQALIVMLTRAFGACSNAYIACARAASM
jgi:hypothetical protein